MAHAWKHAKKFNIIRSVAIFLLGNFGKIFLHKINIIHIYRLFHYQIDKFAGGVAGSESGNSESNTNAGPKMQQLRAMALRSNENKHINSNTLTGKKMTD